MKAKTGLMMLLIGVSIMLFSCSKRVHCDAYTNGFKLEKYNQLESAWENQKVITNQN